MKSLMEDIKEADQLLHLSLSVVLKGQRLVLLQLKAFTVVLILFTSR